MQLSLSVQLPVLKGGLDGSACYITTRKLLSTTRLQEILDAHPSYSTLSNALSHIHTIHCPTLSVLFHVIQLMVPPLIQSVDQTKKMKLLVIDNISEVLQLEESTTTRSVVDRSHDIVTLSGLLHNLASQFDILVMVLTDAKQGFQSPVKGQHTSLPYALHAVWFCQPKGNSTIEAGMGISWANQLNSRIILSAQVSALNISKISPL
jgi:DNA repair protein RAD57